MRTIITLLVVFSWFGFNAYANANSPKTVNSNIAPVPVATYLHSEKPVPRFSVDASWPTLPDTWILGQVSGLSVDKHDNIWILQRPNSLSKFDTGLTATPPTAVCCEAAPHVIRFSPDGKVATAWGGPEHAPVVEGVNQWPVNVHGLFVDDSDTVWIAGNGKDDHVVLNFDFEGKYLNALGTRGNTNGNFDNTTLGNPSDIFHDESRGEVVISDGYINARVASFNTETKRATHLWGAYAEEPKGPTREGDFDQSQAAQPQAQGVDGDNPLFGNIIHCVNQASDGLIYVCDRRNNRVQIFKRQTDGKVTFVSNLVVAGDTGGTGSATDIAFSPDEVYLYVADMMNGRIWIYERSSLTLLASMGRNGRYPGQFTWLHSIDTDSHGNIYTTEVNTGRRVQKLVFEGIK
jgi:hypothetical protein